MFPEFLKADYPKSGESLRPYLRPVRPLLDHNGLKLDLLIGDVRASLLGSLTGYGGDASLVLSYKDSYGAIACLEIDSENILRVLQYKGIKSQRSYRLFSGAKVDELYADEIVKIARAAENSAVKVARFVDARDAIETERGGSRLTSLGILILARSGANGTNPNS